MKNLSFEKLYFSKNAWEFEKLLLLLVLQVTALLSI